MELFLNVDIYLKEINAISLWYLIANAHLNVVSQTQGTEIEIDDFDLINIKGHQKVISLPAEWEKLFANQKLSKHLVSRTYKK